MMGDMRPKRGPPNYPNRCPILQIPLEIREKIYSYLLVHERPIIVKEDWITVERNPFQSHAIIQTCKQFAEEASRFVYKSNVFKAVLRNPTTIHIQTPRRPCRAPPQVSLPLPKHHHQLLSPLLES
jgi:hypothetical protein